MNIWQKKKWVFFLSVLTLVVLCFLYFFLVRSKVQGVSSPDGEQSPFPDPDVTLPLSSLKTGSDLPKKEKALDSKKSVVVALGSEPRTLDPRKATDAGGMRIADLLFHSLVYRGPRLKILPSVAQSWSYKDKVWTFTVDKGLKFSNGRELTKEDLIFSFEEYRSEKSPFASAFQIIESLNIEEETERFLLKIKLKKESAKFLSADLPVLKILPKKEILLDGSGFQKVPFGTGPFKLESKTSSQLVLTARSDVKSPPKIDRVVFKIIRDDFTRFQKMLNGEIDIAQSEIGFQKIGHFDKKKDQFQVVRRPGLSITYLLFNFKDECLKQKETRQAIAFSINRLDIIKNKLKNFARPAVTILGPNNFFFNAYVKNPAYNLEKARNVFLNLPLSCRQKSFSLKTSNARSAIDHGRILALQLKKAGFKTRTESFEWGTFYGDLNAGRFQLALLKWVGAMDPDIYRLAFHSKEQAPKGRNRGFYENKVLDQLLDQGIITLNRQKRRALYNQAQEIVQDDLVFIPLWHEDQITVVKKNILNYYLSDNGDFRYLTEVEKFNHP